MYNACNFPTFRHKRTLMVDMPLKSIKQFLVGIFCGETIKWSKTDYVWWTPI